MNNEINNVVANASLANYHKHIKRVDAFMFFTISAIVLGFIAIVLVIASGALGSNGILTAGVIFWVLAIIVGIIAFIYAALILGSLSSLQYSDNPLIAKIYQENYSICLILFIVGIFIGITWIVLIVFYVKTKNELKQILAIQAQ